VNVKILSACPNEYCNNQVVTKTRGLRILFKKYYDALTASNSQVSGRAQLEICIQIKVQQSQLKWLNQAQTVGWPIDIDFQGLPDCVMKMKDEIAQLLFDEGLASDDTVLCQFVKDLQVKGYTTEESIEKFKHAKGTPEVILKHAQPG
jgi:hypothetical protein